MVRLDERRAGDLGGNGGRVWRRSRDRRSAMATLLAALATELAEPGDVESLGSRLEGSLKDVLKLAGARLRGRMDRPAPASTGGGVGTEVASFAVPGRPGGTRVVLEAAPAGRPRFDVWELQVLEMTSNLAALVLELDRRRQSVVPRQTCLTRAPDSATPPLVGSSPEMTCLRERIAKVAATDFTVLIQGESGTGKELVARQIHAQSRRRHGPFVAVNCAAIVESLLEAELFGIEDRTATGVRGRRGKFEHADGGTLFLDEVSDLAPSAQAKLLRAIQELTVERVGGNATRRVDTRIVVATNRSLRELSAQGLFRDDLYYRLSGVELHVPPLRRRRNDILELSRHFLGRYRLPVPLALSPEAAEAIQVYDWPGNVRELERVIEGAVTLARSEWIAIEDLPPALRGGGAEALLASANRNDSMRAWGARYARLILERCERNKRRACRVLNISYHTLQAYLAWQDDGADTPAPVDWPDDRGAGSPPAQAPSPVAASETPAACG
jgi:DNA-binding NtrC family response regulator